MPFYQNNLKRTRKICAVLVQGRIKYSGYVRVDILWKQGRYATTCQYVFLINLSNCNIRWFYFWNTWKRKAFLSCPTLRSLFKQMTKKADHRNHGIRLNQSDQEFVCPLLWNLSSVIINEKRYSSEKTPLYIN